MGWASRLQLVGAAVASLSVGAGVGWWVGGVIGGAFLLVFGVAMERGS